MAPEHQNQVKTAVEIAAVSTVNALSWGAFAQDVAPIFTLFLTFVTIIWVVVQTLRFVQKWIREDNIFGKRNLPNE